MTSFLLILFSQIFLITNYCLISRHESLLLVGPKFTQKSREITARINAVPGSTVQIPYSVSRTG